MSLEQQFAAIVSRHPSPDQADDVTTDRVLTMEELLADDGPGSHFSAVDTSSIRGEKRDAASAAVATTPDVDDADTRGEKKARVDAEEVAEEAEAAEELIAAEFAAVCMNDTTIELALRPILPPNDVAVHTKRKVVIALDHSGSMKGAGLVGLQTFVSNFDKLITLDMRNRSISAEEEEIFRRNTEVLFVYFGDHTGTYKGASDFVPATSVELENVLKIVKPQLDAELGYTNIEDAIAVSERKLAARFRATHDEDVSQGFARLGAIILVTDGVPNGGNCDPHSIVKKHIGTNVSNIHSFETPISLFAVGVGDHVSPTFLSSLVEDTGFWNYAEDPHDLIKAFSKTFGAVITALSPFVVRVTTTVLRNGDDEAASTTTCTNRGVVSSESTDSIIVKAFLPPDTAMPHDTVRFTVRMAGYFSASLTMPVVGSGNSARIPVPKPSNSKLFKEARENLSCLEMLKEEMVKNPSAAYGVVTEAFANNPVALKRIDGTIDLLAESQRFRDRPSFLEALSSQPTMSYQPSFASPAPFGAAPTPSFSHSLESSLSRARRSSM